MITTGSTPPDSTRLPLTDKQVNELITFSNEHSDLDLGDVVKVILNTGLRVSELCKLRWADVDHLKLQLVVHDAKSACRRVVPFGPKTLKILEARRERHPASEYVLGKSPRGLVNRISLQLRTQPGLKRLALNTLRHTCFYRLFNSGASFNSLWVIGGWKSRLGFKTLLSAERQYEIAARDQALIELG